MFCEAGELLVTDQPVLNSETSSYFSIKYSMDLMGGAFNKKGCSSSIMTIWTPIVLLCRECYAYYLSSWQHGNRYCS